MSQNHDLLDRLRTAKEQRHYTYQDIVDLTEQNGEAVSMTTVRRVFSEGAHLENFRFNQTVAPIVHALLDEGNEPVETERAETAPVEEIERLKSELEQIRQHEREVIEKAQEGVQNQIDNYLGNIIEERNAAYRWYKKAIVIIAILVCASLILDLAFGSVGLIRY